jgi:TRAP-type C4-dicarboxylate transport system substrate-binding protein
VPETLPNALVLALVAFQVLVTGLLAYRSLPMQLRRTVEQTADVALSAERTANATREAWTEEKARLAGIQEAVEGVLDQVEKKRARVVSENRRAEQRVELEQHGGDKKSELRRRAGLI